MAINRAAQSVESRNSVSLEMTLRYAHLAPGHKMKAVNILYNVLIKPHVKNTQLDSFQF